MLKRSLILILLFSNRTYSQTLSDSIFLTIESYKATILDDERDYNVVLKLVNNGSKPIVTWNTAERQLYYKAVYLTDNHDTLTNKNWFEKADVQYTSQPYKKAIEPGESIFIKHSLIADLYRAGSVKVKFIFDLSTLNKEIKDIETAWISMYVSCTYNELFQSIK